MSDPQGHEAETVASDGITVTKRFEEEGFPVPAIAFEFTSGRDETVRIRLSDRVPEGVAVEDLGFHPEYGSEHWTIENETITFERELDAGAEYTTVYGIRATGADDVEQFLTEPTLEAVDPPLPGDGTPDPDDDVISGGDDVIRDILSGDGDVPGLEDESERERGTADDPEPIDLEGSGAGGSSTVDGGVIAAMAAEIRNDAVSTEDLELVGRAFDRVADGTADGTTDARIDKLQSDIADLRAYTDALEEFLDENGTAEQVVEEFESRLDEFAAELESVQPEVQSNRDTIEGLDDTVGSVRNEVDELSADVEAVESTLRDLDDAVDDVRASVERLETDDDVVERIDDIESDVTDLREWQEQIRQTFGG